MEFDSRFLLEVNMGDRNYAISIAEGIALELTNPTSWKIDDIDLLMTDKSIYFWSSLAAHLVIRFDESEIEGILDKLSAVGTVLASDAGALGRWRIPRFRYINPYYEYYLVEFILNRIGFEENDIYFIAEDVERTYRSLLEKGLVVDPPKIWLRNVMVAAIGLLPMDLSYKTGEGQKILLEYKSLLIQYNEDQENGRVVSRHLQASELTKKMLTTFVESISKVNPTPENLEENNE